MAKNFRELRDKMPASALKKSHELAQKYKSEMALDELRVARQMTQEHLAKSLRVKQSAISKIERRTDLYLSTLETIIKAMGGRLILEAVFPDGRTTLDLRPKKKAA